MPAASRFPLGLVDCGLLNPKVICSQSGYGGYGQRGLNKTGDLCLFRTNAYFLAFIISTSDTPPSFLHLSPNSAISATTSRKRRKKRMRKSVTLNINNSIVPSAVAPYPGTMKTALSPGIVKR